jgi:sulfate adenylyltransferase subunit 2
MSGVPGAGDHEIAAIRITERRQTRADDRTSEAAMEDRKREWYF